MIALGNNLFSAVVEVSNRCNFRCPFCASDSGCARENEMTLDEMRGVVRDLAALGCRECTMLGGEFLLRPDWYEIARAVKDAGMELQLITNGLLVTEFRASLSGVGFAYVRRDGERLRVIADSLRTSGAGDGRNRVFVRDGTGCLRTWEFGSREIASVCEDDRNALLRMLFFRTYDPDESKDDVRAGGGEGRGRGRDFVKAGRFRQKQFVRIEKFRLRNVAGLRNSFAEIKSPDEWREAVSRHERWLR